MSDSTIEAALRDVAQLSANAAHHDWAVAMAVVEAIRSEERGGVSAGRHELLKKFASATGGAYATLARDVRTVEQLVDLGLENVHRQPVLLLGTVAAIVCSALPPETKKALVEKYYDQALKNPAPPPSREDVRGAVRALLPDDSRHEDWHLSGDDWRFRGFDRRLGRADQPWRLPGGAALNLVHRFWPREGRIVSAFCGSGTVLDACDILGVPDFIGLDLRRDERIRERHSDRVAEFDCTSLDWERICAPGAAGLIVITPPPHTFGHSAETDSPRDLGRLVDPHEWVAAMEHVIAGATPALMVGGVVAVNLRATSEFEHGTPVPDLRYEIGRLLADAKYEFFLGNPVITIGRPCAKQHDGAWLRPEVVQFVILRKSHP